MTTEEAFDKLKKGDEKAFELIYKEYFSRLCLLSRKIVGDSVIAEDIVQQLFFTLWNNRAKIIIETTGGGYLARSVYNLSLQHIRQNTIRGRHHTIIYDNSYASDSYFDQQLDIASDDEKIERLRKAMQLLPEQCRTILTLSRFNNERSTEIAEELNLSVRTVENQLYIALKKLKEHFNDNKLFGIIIVIYSVIKIFL